MKTKAAVMYESKAPLVVEEIELDPPKAGEILVKLTATGICQSDLHAWKQDWSMFIPPIVLGHEGAGVVEQVGEGVTHVQPGDKVVLTYLPACGACQWCHRGEPYLCDLTAMLASGKMLDGTSRLHSASGTELSHFLFVSTFSQYTVAPAASVIKMLPDDRLERLCLLGCGATTGFGAAWRAVQVGHGDTVLVMGCGGLGLNTIQAAAIGGASKIIAVDIHEEKLVLARQFGATHAIKNTHDLFGVVGQVMEITEGIGVDYGFEVVGGDEIDETMVMTFSAVRKGGTMIQVGVPSDSKTTSPISPFILSMYNKNIKGISFGRTQFKTDIPKLAQMYRNGAMKLDELVHEELPLEKINQGFESIMAGNKGGRTVIRFD